MLWKSRPKSDTEAITELAKRQQAYYAKTTGAETLTAAQMIDGIVEQTGAQGAYALTTPTATQLLAGMFDPEIGDTFEFTLNNSAGGATITVTAGTDVTLAGVATVVATEAQRFIGRVTAVGTPAVRLMRA